MTEWWEKEPIRFECQADCFKCCCKPGLVFFDREDIGNVAAHLDCTPKEFKATYLAKDDVHWALEVEGDSPCTFLTADGCGIHAVKPKQCRAYPFWKENLESRNMWRMVGGFCPGVDKGPMVALETIKDFLKKFRL